MAKLLPEPVPATSTWWAWLSDAVAENQRSVPWTVIVASWSTPPETPGTVRAAHWSDPTGERSSTTSEQLPLLADANQGEGVPPTATERQ